MQRLRSLPPLPRLQAVDLVLVMARVFLVLAAAAAVHGLVVLQPAPMRCHSLTAQTCRVPGTCAQVRPPAGRRPSARLRLHLRSEAPRPTRQVLRPGDAVLAERGVVAMPARTVCRARASMSLVRWGAAAAAAAAGGYFVVVQGAAKKKKQQELEMELMLNSYIPADSAPGLQYPLAA